MEHLTPEIDIHAWGKLSDDEAVQAGREVCDKLLAIAQEKLTTKQPRTVRMTKNQVRAVFLYEVFRLKEKMGLIKQDAKSIGAFVSDFEIYNTISQYQAYADNPEMFYGSLYGLSVTVIDRFWLDINDVIKDNNDV